MSFYNLPGGWDAGFAIPEYIQAEVPGRGTMTTKWLPRGTISTLYPDVLMQPALKAKSLGAVERFELTPISHKSAWSTVGDVPDATNPFVQGGHEIANHLIDELRTVPAPYRKIALRATLDAVKPGLFKTAGALAERYKSEGMSANAALRRALAEQITKGFVKEIGKAGRTGKVEINGQLGLGAWGTTSYAMAMGDAYAELGWWPGSNIASAAKSAYSGVKTGATATWSGIQTAGSAVGRGASATWGGIKTGAQYAAKYAGKGIKYWAKIQCKMLNLPGSEMAAAAIATAYGIPPQAGMKGVQIAKGLCTKYVTGSPGKPPLPSPEGAFVPDWGGPPQGRGATPAWVLPAAIGGGGLLLFLALK